MEHVPNSIRGVEGLAAYQEEHRRGEIYYYLLGVTVNDDGRKEVFIEKSEGEKKIIASELFDINTGNKYY